MKKYNVTLNSVKTSARRKYDRYKIPLDEYALRERYRSEKPSITEISESDISLPETSNIHKLERIKEPGMKKLHTNNTQELERIKEPEVTFDQFKNLPWKEVMEELKKIFPGIEDKILRRQYDGRRSRLIDWNPGEKITDELVLESLRRSEKEKKEKEENNDQEQQWMSLAKNKLNKFLKIAQILDNNGKYKEADNLFK